MQASPAQHSPQKVSASKRKFLDGNGNIYEWKKKSHTLNLFNYQLTSPSWALNFSIKVCGRQGRERRGGASGRTRPESMKKAKQRPCRREVGVQSQVWAGVIHRDQVGLGIIFGKEIFVKR